MFDGYPILEVEFDVGKFNQYAYMIVFPVNYATYVYNISHMPRAVTNFVSFIVALEEMCEFSHRVGVENIKKFMIQDDLYEKLQLEYLED